MNAPLPVARGRRAVGRLLQERTFDLRSLDLSDFRRWLRHHLTGWQRDAVFQHRVTIRELRRRHSSLLIAERELRRIADADAATWQSARLRQLDRELVNAQKAIDGLSAALETRPLADRRELQRKRKGFAERQRQLREEQDRLIESSPARLALLHARDVLQQLRATVGLDREEARLDGLLKQRGRRTGRSGTSFERLAADVTETQIVPDFVSRRSVASAHRPILLRGVTLGAAQIEFDQLIVRRPRRVGGPVDVLAAVEVKRNANDLAHGFRRRQADLAWLTGDAAEHDPERYRTRQFPSGHFDRDAGHMHEGETFLFNRRSFRRFHRDRHAGQFLHRLYFVTRPGPLWGISTAALSRISYRVATDERWNFEDDEYLHRLMHWCQSLADPIETPDVLRQYVATPRLCRQILFAEG